MSYTLIDPFFHSSKRLPFFRSQEVPRSTYLLRPSGAAEPGEQQLLWNFLGMFACELLQVGGRHQTFLDVVGLLQQLVYLVQRGANVWRCRRWATQEDVDWAGILGCRGGWEWNHYILQSVTCHQDGCGWIKSSFRSKKHRVNWQTWH